MGKDPKPKKKAPAPYSVPQKSSNPLTIVLDKLGDDPEAIRALLRLATASSGPQPEDDSADDADEGDDNDTTPIAQPTASSSTPSSQFPDPNAVINDLKDQIAATVEQMKDADNSIASLEKNINDGVIPADLITTANAHLTKARGLKKTLVASHANFQEKLTDAMAILATSQAPYIPPSHLPAKKPKQSSITKAKASEDNRPPLTPEQVFLIAQLRESAGLSVGEPAPPRSTAATSTIAATELISEAALAPSNDPSINHPTIQPWNLMAGFANPPAIEPVDSTPASPISIRLPPKKSRSITAHHSPSPSLSGDIIANPSSPSPKPKGRVTKNSLRAAAEAAASTETATDEQPNSRATPSTLTAGESFSASDPSV